MAKAMRSGDAAGSEAVSGGDNRSGSPAGGRRADLIAAEIERGVLQSGWPVGTVLGSEAELLERFGASRAVIREAVRLLEHRQVAHMRRGPGGGLVITAPGPGAATEALATYLEYVGIGEHHLVEVMEVLAPLAARLACERIRERDIIALRSGFEQLSLSSDGVPADAQEFVDSEIARMARNPVLFLFLSVLKGLSPPAPVDDTCAPARSRELVEAVCCGEAEEAAALARRSIAARHPEIAGSDAPGDHGSTVALSPPSNAKLAELVAAELRHRIIERGWPVGELLGSEAELVEELGLSHAVFREAVRILEHHNVAQVRRGRKGGLFISAPDPLALADAVSRYLDFAGFAEADLHAVRSSLELHCLDLAVRRYPGADEDEITRYLKVGPVTPLETVNIFSHDFHVGLAETSGNPILHVFVAVLTNLCAWHCGPLGEPGTGSPSHRDAVENTHARIADAILRGDRAVARHRMLRHLEALRTYWDVDRLGTASTSVG